LSNKGKLKQAKVYKKMALNQEKYKNAVLYYSHNLNRFQLGRTKLAKLLYYLDFINYRDEKETVTGDIYFKQDHGPLPGNLSLIIGQLADSGKLSVDRRDIELPDGSLITMDSFDAPDEPNMNVFDESEQVLLRKILNRYRGWKTGEIEAKSHLEAPWFKAEYGSALSFDDANDIDDFSDGEDLEDEEDKGIKTALNEALSNIK